MIYLVYLRNQAAFHTRSVDIGFCHDKPTPRVIFKHPQNLFCHGWFLYPPPNTLHQIMAIWQVLIEICNSSKVIIQYTYFNPNLLWSYPGKMETRYFNIICNKTYGYWSPIARMKYYSTPYCPKSKTYNQVNNSGTAWLNPSPYYQSTAKADSLHWWNLNPKPSHFT